MSHISSPGKYRGIGGHLFSHDRFNLLTLPPRFPVFQPAQTERRNGGGLTVSIAGVIAQEETRQADPLLQLWE